MRPISTSSARVLRVGGGSAAVAGMLLVGLGTAGADPIDAGTASAYGAHISAAGSEVITEPSVTQDGIGDQSLTTVDVPADPVAVSGTLIATANVHEESDLTSALTVFTQELAGPYNVQAVGQIEGAQVVTENAGLGVTLVEAAAIRAEAVAVCTAGGVQYSAMSEIIDLNVGGEDVVEGNIPLNDVLNQVIDALNENLFDAGLDAVVDINRNVITETEDGIAVDALEVILLSALGEDPLARVVLGHAEVSGANCAAAAPPVTPAPPVAGPPLGGLPNTGGTTQTFAGLGLLASAAVALGFARKAKAI